MTAQDTNLVYCNPPFDAKAAREALDRGELLQLVAAVESGRITADQLESVLEDRDRHQWFRRILMTILNR